MTTEVRANLFGALKVAGIVLGIGAVFTVQMMGMALLATGTYYLPSPFDAMLAAAVYGWGITIVAALIIGVIRWFIDHDPY